MFALPIGQKTRAQVPATDGSSLVSHKLVRVGGRPLPERPLWLRLLIVAVVLGGVAPLIKGASVALPLFGINRPAKMTAEETARVIAAESPEAQPMIGSPRSSHDPNQ